MKIKLKRLLLLLLTVVILSCGCAPTAVTTATTQPPSPTAAAAPAAAQPIAIVLPDYNQSAFIAVNRHYSGLMKEKGWDVEFYTAQDIYDDNGNSSYLKYVEMQLASGQAKADGYVIYNNFGDENVKQMIGLAKDGLILDVKAAAPKAIPQYNDKYRAFIEKSIIGLPLSFGRTTMRGKSVFIVHPDFRKFLPEHVTSYQDIIAFINKVNQADTDKYNIAAPYSSMLECWATAQGYMPLTLFQIGGGYVYTAIDDPEAKPVLLEKIPGFQRFLTDILDFYRSGVLATDVSAESENTIAALSYAGFSFDYTNLGDWAKEFLAYPLYTNEKHSNVRGLAPIVNACEMVIPASSRKAYDVIRFIEWTYSAQENYDAVMYGQEGVDYSLVEKRINIHDSQNRPLTSMEQAQRWAGTNVFYHYEFDRIDVKALSNAEQIKTAWKDLPLAAPYLVDARMNQSIPKQLEYDAETDLVITKRNNNLVDIEQSISDHKKVDIKSMLARLASLDNGLVLQAYEKKMKQLRDAQIK